MSEKRWAEQISEETTIQDVAKALVQRAKDTGAPASTTFRACGLGANPSSTTEDVILAYAEALGWMNERLLEHDKARRCAVMRLLEEFL